MISYGVKLLHVEEAGLKTELFHLDVHLLPACCVLLPRLIFEPLKCAKGAEMSQKLSKDARSLCV